MADKSNSLGIEPIESLTMVDQVELKLREYFRDNEFKPGDSIPKETELAKALGVSRNVVREALSRFRMQRLVETKKRRGMIFSHPDLLSGIERLLDPQILGEDTLQDIFELRLVLEMGLAELLYLHKEEKDVEELEDIVEKQDLGADREARLKHELEFHGKIYQMTDNSTLGRFQEMLLPIFEYVSLQEEKISDSPIVGEVTHKDLVAILKNGSPERYREGMYKHLKPHFERLGEK